MVLRGHINAAAPCAQVRDQASQLTKLRADAQLLDSSLQESQRQAMALGTRLTLTENKNEELISQNQVLMLP